MPKKTITQLNFNLASSVSLSLDSLAGARYTACGAAQLTINEPRLRYLHLVGDQHLRELNLSSCAAGLHLNLSGCPNLRLVRLPTAGEGAVVHLDAGTVQPELKLRGAVRSFDACWDEGGFAAEARDGAPAFRDALVGSSLPAGTALPELCILLGSEIAEIALVSDGVRQLLVHNAPSLEHVLLHRVAPLELLELSACSNLASITSSSRINRLRLSSCPAVREVFVAAGGSARFGEGSGARAGLHITGPWQHLTLSGSSIERLDSPSVNRLLVRDCAALERALVAADAEVALSGTCRLVVEGLIKLALDERAISGLLSRALAGDGQATEMLHNWCSLPRKARERIEALRALASADQRSPQLLWSLRCRLHQGGSRDRQPTLEACLKYAQQRWEWVFPNDLYQEGWGADLQLWSVCRGWAAAGRSEALLRSGDSLLALAALARVLANTQEAEPVLLELLRTGLKRGAAAKPTNDGFMREQARRAFEQILQVAVAYRDRDLADALIQRMHRTLRLHHAIHLLGSLAALGHARARVELMGLAQRLSRDPELRARALSLALAPLRTNVFGEQEVIHAE